MSDDWTRRIVALAMVIGSAICFPTDLAEGKTILFDIGFFFLGAILLIADLMIWIKCRHTGKG